MRDLFWTTGQLHARGLSAREVGRRVDSGLLLPVRRGLWASPEAPAELVRVARTGGAATATTGARALGLWTPPDDRLQLAVPAGASRLRDPDDATRPLAGDVDVCVHWTKRMPAVHSLGDRVAPLLLVLEHAVRCLRSELAVAILDSALHGGLLRQRDLPALTLALPAHLRRVLLLVDGRSDSGLESIVRVLLRAAGFDVVVHAVLPGIGEVDLLVNGVLIIETDGRRWHSAESAFFRDRHRDRTAMIDGYRVLRLHQWQVLEEWPECLRAVRAALP